MSDMKHGQEPENREDFLREADADRIGLAAEFWDFLKHNKKWWLIPILITIAIIAVIAFIGTNPAVAPYIYPLF